jgi:NTP pyrophosphatase (non-canonical NTP hydrolase)
MNLNDYQKLAARTIPVDRDKTERVKEYTLALCEEAAESAGILKKVLYHHHPLTNEKFIHLKEELGDTLWHIAALATEHGMTLEDVAGFNVNKLKSRYPEGYSDERSVNRNDQ